MDQLITTLLRYYLTLEIVPLIILSFGVGVVLVGSVIYAWQHVREVGRFEDI